LLLLVGVEVEEIMVVVRGLVVLEQEQVYL
jgi:hypothetical protein